jgi:hypothetical protein
MNYAVQERHGPNQVGGFSKTLTVKEEELWS